jgi:hypothetical protein
MPKSIVPSPAAVVAVDRLTLQATDARATDDGAGPSFQAFCNVLNSCSCFSEE